MFDWVLNRPDTFKETFYSLHKYFRRSEITNMMYRVTTMELKAAQEIQSIFFKIHFTIVLTQ